MTTGEIRDGGCLCGRVRYQAAGTTRGVLQCHCENCRRLTGNFVAALRTSTDDLVITDPTGHFGWYELGYASYGFCRGCGSTLFFRSTENPERTSVMVGTFDNSSGLEVDAVWFADEAQPHNELPTGVPHHAANG